MAVADHSEVTVHLVEVVAVHPVVRLVAVAVHLVAVVVVAHLAAAQFYQEGVILGTMCSHRNDTEA